MPSTISKIEVNNVKHDIRASKLGDSTVGGTASPIYLEDGIPKECTELLNVEKSSINGNIKINNIETPVYIHPSSTITIKQEGIIKGTFTTNQSGNTTIELSDENTDTKNTAGSTNTSSKLFLVGATSQEANPQTYSHDTAYVGTDGCLYSGGQKTSVEGHSHYELHTVTVSASNWISSGNSYTNSLTVNGVTSNSDVQVIPRDDWTDDQRITYINAEILSGSQSSDTVILRAVGAKPVIDFNVDILVGDIIG